MSENRRIDPTSTLATSLTFSTHVPFGFCPSNADNRLFGVNDVEDGNAAVLAEGISTVLADEGLRNQLIETAKVFVKNYSWDKTAQETISFYKTLI